MDDLSPPYRPATPRDAAALADLVDFAGEGLPSYVWARMAGEGETPKELGRRRAEREEGSFSYRNSVVADLGSGPVAALIGYALPVRPEPIPDDFPPMFVPLQELENLACGTWYVNVLAAYPEHRRQGHGTRLLEIADRLAARAGARCVSIIVSDGNAPARRLYERRGYRTVAARPIVKEDWQHTGDNWLLLLPQSAG